MQNNGDQPAPSSLCDLIDGFLSERGRSLFPENLRLERRYLTDPIVQIEHETLRRALFVMFSSLFTTGSASSGGTIKILVSSTEDGFAEINLTYEGTPGTSIPPVPDMEDLASAVDLLAKYDGNLSFTGRAGDSSIIIFNLPVCSAIEEDDYESDLNIPPLDHPGIASFSVLIADDEAPIRDLLGTIVKSTGVVLIEYARNGEEAYKRYMEKRHDLIFMDMAMPVLTGKEAYDRITAEDHSARVVFITGLYQDEEIPEIADDIEAFGYVKKPFNISQVRNIIEKALQD